VTAPIKDDPGSPKKPDYEVGYGRPPQATRFQKGRSGNVRGRPRKRRHVPTLREVRQDFLSVAQEPVSITMGGKTRKVPLIVAVYHRLLLEAAKGKPSAMKLAVEWHRMLTNESEEVQARFAKMLIDAERNVAGGLVEEHEDGPMTPEEREQVRADLRRLAASRTDRDGF
jgi:hypothetical protein